MPSGLIYPSYKTGFASPQRDRMLYPQLWKGCVGAWNPGLGPTGARLFDHSGYGNNGTLTNMDPGTDWVASEGKIALDFDGSDDYVDLGALVIPQSEGTMSLWWYPDESVSSSMHPLFRSRNIGLDALFDIYLYYASLYAGWFKAFTNDDRIAWPISGISQGTWNNVLLTWRNGGVTQLHINGVYIGERSGLDATWDTSTGTNYIACDSASSYAKMLIDDIRICNRVLTPSEVILLAQRRGIAYETYRTIAVRGAVAVGPPVTPTTAALTLTTFEPTVSTPVAVTPTTATLTLTAFAPTVTTPQTLTPSTAALTLTTFAPTVSTPILATPTTATLSLATFAPTVTTPQTLTPTTTSLTLTTFEPTVSVSNANTVTPTTATLSLTTFAPTVTTPQTLTPTTASLTLTTFAPTVTTPQTLTPTTTSLTLTTFEPTVSVSNANTVTPTTASLSLATFAPTVTATANITVTPTTLALSLTEYAPTITVGGTVNSLTIDFQGSGVASSSTAVAANAGALASSDTDGPLAVNSNNN